MTRSTVFLSAILLVSQVAFAEPDTKAQATGPAEHDWHVHDIVTVEVNGVTALPKNVPHPRRIAANVVDIRPNGDLVLEGRSEFLDGDQVWDKSVTGVVPQKSIGKDRTVSSTKLTDLKIRTRSKGTIERPAANSKPPQPVQLVAAQAPVSPKVEDLHKKLSELNRLQEEVRQLRAETGTPQMILVKLQMLEISLSKLRRMGTDVNLVGSKTIKVEDLESLAKVAQNSAGNKDALPGFINWLKENNVARAVSEPRMMMLDGRPASLNIGCEIPIPARGDSKSAVEFQQVGTQVDILPTALGNDRVRLQVRARVSDEDESRSVEVGGSHVPAITVRQCDTVVETEFGRSVVLNGGLVEERTHTIKRDDGKTEDVVNQIALIFVVTPELVENSETANVPYTPPSPK